eukprot:9823352-Ditylum_brightwellii.AAC.1
MIPVSYKHGLAAGALNSRQLELMEDYHPIMGLCGNTMQYQISQQSGMSAITQRANDVPENWGFKSWTSGAVDVVQLHKDDDGNEPFIQGIRQRLDMLRKHSIQSLLDDNPSWNAPQDKPAQTLFIPSGAAFVLNLQAASAAMHSTSPDSRVMQHRKWGSTLVTASNVTKQVELGALFQDFEEILCVTGSKSD